MTTRAWWLVGLNLAIPGSAQVLAGSRRLGRFGLGTTLVWWLLVVASAVTAVVDRSVLFALVTNAFPLGVVVVVLAFYATVWVVLTLDTLRLIRFVAVDRGARAVVAGVAVVALVVVSGGAVFTATRAVSAIGVLSTVFGDGSIAEPIDGRYNVLLLGGDAGPDRFGLRPDSISVVSVDAATGSTVIFGVPRNMQHVPFAAGSPLWGPFPNGYDCGLECLISYLYTYGEEHPDLYPDAVAQGSSPGIEATRDAVSGVLGLELQYFVLIDMQGFVALVDALGGIDLTVTERLPIEGGEDTNGQPIGVAGWIEPGPQHMDGYTALWYARSRHGTSDYDRMARQREIQSAVLTQMDPANVLLRFNEIAAAGGSLIRTDIPQLMLSQFVELGLQAQDQPLETLDFVPEEWSTERPDFAAIQATVDELLRPRTPSFSP
jgi:LCP family protein required for cell wall assembly